MTVSLNMIVRDEAANLAALLPQVANVVGELVIVDTGSKDETKRVAASFGARVFDFPWCDDFSAARNEALRHSSGEWVLMLDADDRVPKTEQEKLRALLRDANPRCGGYSMGCVCIGRDGGVTDEVEQVRLFRRTSGVRWRHRIHEQIHASIEETGAPIERTGVRIVHTGYRDARMLANKTERNLRLLDLELLEAPLDARVLFHRGATLLALKRPEEAVVSLQLAEPGANPASDSGRRLKKFLACAQHDCGDISAALETIRSARHFFPYDPELAHVEASMLIELGAVDQARAILESVAHYAKRDVTVHDIAAWSLLAGLQIVRGNAKDAETIARMAIARRHSYGEAWLVLADALIAQHDDAKLDALLERLSEIESTEAARALIRAARVAVDDPIAAMRCLNDDGDLPDKLRANLARRTGPPHLVFLHAPWMFTNATNGFAPNAEGAPHRSSFIASRHSQHVMGS